MKRNVFSYLKLLPLITLLAFAGNSAFAGAYYIVNSNPWGNTQNQTCMNNVIGVCI